MKFYLSSYKLGNATGRLKNLVPNRKIGYIPNALDFSYADAERRRKSIKEDVNSLRGLGLEVELVNLRDYFNKHEALRQKLEELQAIFISGGNVFVLRQAMKLSSFDKILKDLQAENDFLYAGYSAAGCVLAPNLKVYEIVDKPDIPYEELKEIIWEGLGLVDFTFMPHWDSDHPESDDIDKEIEFCKKNNIRYKAIKDGEVLIFEL